MSKKSKKQVGKHVPSSAESSRSDSKGESDCFQPEAWKPDFRNPAFDRRSRLVLQRPNSLSESGAAKRSRTK